MDFKRELDGALDKNDADRLLEADSSHLKIGQNPKRKDEIPTIRFSFRVCVVCKQKNGFEPFNAYSDSPFCAPTLYPFMQNVNGVLQLGDFSCIMN